MNNLGVGLYAIIVVLHEPLQLNNKIIAIAQQEKGSSDVLQSQCFIIDKQHVTCNLKLFSYIYPVN